MDQPKSNASDSANANAQSAGLAGPTFPCQSFPTEPRLAKLLGVIPQRQPGLWIQRVRIPGGILLADQWRVLAKLARQLTPNTPLHLTTRQDIELHDLSADNVPVAQQGLAGAGMTSLGSGGDTLRNVVVCPRSAGGTSEVPDLLPLAQTIAGALRAYDGIYALPRKFKISLACGRGPGRPFIHDIGFVARQRDGRWGLEVVVAGSLGARPGLGIEFLDWIEPAEALPLALAAVRLFAKHGDRQNRTQARLRHVRQNMGDDAFRQALLREFELVRSEQAWPGIVLNVAGGVGLAERTLTFPNGDITPDAADALAGLADLPGLGVRIGADHRVIVLATDTSACDEQIGRLPALAGNAKMQASVVACPGTRWCSRALADTNSLADRIRAALADKVGCDLCIAVAGCPNGCSQGAVADIGVFGGKSSTDGKTVEKYDILSGGGRGATDVLARPAAAGLSADQALAEVARLAQTLVR
jgi:sulfite reductase (ferredoxin)